MRVAQIYILPLKGTNFKHIFTARYPKTHRDNCSNNHLDSNTLSGIILQMLTPKRYDENPRHFYVRVPSLENYIPKQIWQFFIKST